MSFQPQIPLQGIAGWRFLERTQETQQAAFDKGPQMAREIAYFEENIGKVTSTAELMSDRRLLKVALGAFGLEQDIDKKAWIRKILDEGTDGSQGARGAPDGQVLRQAVGRVRFRRRGWRAHRPAGLRARDHRRLPGAVLRGRGGRDQQRHAPRDVVPARDRRAGQPGRDRRKLVHRARLQAAAHRDRDRRSVCRPSSVRSTSTASATSCARNRARCSARPISPRSATPRTSTS